MSNEDELSESSQRLLDNLAEKVLTVLLFSEEFPLQDYGVEGSEAFQEAFGGQARQSTSGRSLRDFNLLSRLFKHRCSFMIHSEAFTNLVPELKTRILARLREILEGKEETDSKYGHLKERERERIDAILRDTLEGWR